MAWPTVAVDTTGMDNDTDKLPRAALLDLTTKFNDLIAMRGVAAGVCDLDGSGVIPVARIPSDIARLAGPAFTGNPTAVTQALRNNSTRLATTEFVLANALLNGVLAKSANYTVVAADFGKLVDYTSGSHTLSLDAAATLGAGFVFAFRNSGTGTITIDPNGSEQIDGVTTLSFGSGESGLAVCSGTGWKTVGRFFSRTADVTPIPATGVSLSAAHGLGRVPAVVACEFVCVDAGGDGGYSQGDVVHITGFWNGSTIFPTTCWRDATNVGVVNYTGWEFAFQNKSTGNTFTPAKAKWAYRFLVA